MAVELICPDCGGVIGATEIDEKTGRGPCTCVVEEDYSQYKQQSAPAARSDASSDTVSMPAMPEMPTPESFVPYEKLQAQRAVMGEDESPLPSGSEKMCIVCGKDVTGHRRVKDSRGYMCYTCAKAEIKDEHAGTVVCPHCKRRVKEGGLYLYNAERICRRCLNDHKEAEKKAVKIVPNQHYVEHEKRTLIIWLCVLAALLLIGLLKAFL